LKRENSIKLNSGFVGILGILFTLVIICILILIMFKGYGNKGIFNKEMKRVLSKEGIDTSTYKTTIDSTKKKLNRINKDYNDRLKQLDQLGQ